MFYSSWLVYKSCIINSLLILYIHIVGILCVNFSFIILSDTTRNIHPLILNMPNSVNQLDTHAVDNIIIRCVDGGPSDDRTDNYSISSRHQVIGRRCRTVTTTTTDKSKCSTRMNVRVLYTICFFFIVK